MTELANYLSVSNMLSIITLLPTTPVLLRVESPERMVGGSRLILMEECRGGEGLLVLMMMMGILLVMLLTTRARLK